MNINEARVRRLFGLSVAAARPTTATRVLVVDDDDVIRALLVVALSLEGFTVFEAADGREALEKVALVGPDIAILDAVMPEISGRDVALRLHADAATAGIKVLLLSGADVAGDSNRGGLLDGDAHLAKPFDPAELVALVKRLVA